MIKLIEKMPAMCEGKRVLIYTDGVDFAGQQFFDVEADSLNDAFYKDPEDMPDECKAATHWMELPFPKEL